MNKIGVVLGDLGPSQLSYYVVKNINQRCETTAKDDFVAFVENISTHILEPDFGIMNIGEVWSFDGVLIATSVSTALQVIKAVNSAEKYFYVWDLEWMRQSGHDFAYTVKAFNDPKINLIARSEEHARAIKNYCNREVIGIVDNFNTEQLYKVIQNG